MKVLILLGAVAAVCAAQQVFPPFGAGGSGITGNSAQVVNVAPAASMTFTATSNTITQFIAGAAGSPTPLTANVTAITFSGLTQGQLFSVAVAQNLTLGPYTFGGWPAGFNTACQISSYPGAITTISFIATATGATETGCAPDRGPDQGPIVSFVGDPQAGYYWRGISSTYNTFRLRANSQNFWMPSFTPPLTNHGVLLGGDNVQINVTDPGGEGTFFNGLGGLLDPIWTYTPKLGLEGFTTGTLSLANASSSFLSTITPANFTAARAVTLPDAAGNIAIGYFATNAQTSTYQVLAADFLQCKTIPVASGTFTVTLVASGAQPTSGQCIYVINYGSGVVTIARSGQNINGGTTSLTLAAASATAPTGAYVVSDGANYEAQLFGAPSSSALSSITAAASTNTIASGNNFDQIWNWALTTNSHAAMTFGETTAATNGTLGNQYIVKNITLAGSTAVPMNITSSLTGSQTLPTLHITPTWNTSGVVDAALLINVTNSASGAASKLVDYQIGGTSQWNADKAGNTVQLGSASFGSSAPTCTAGSAGAWCATAGTEFTNVASTSGIYPDSTTNEFMAKTNGASTKGMLVRSQPGAIRSTGLVASVSTATLCAASAGACNTSGLYQVHLSMYQSGSACAANTTNGVLFALTWTDGNGTAHSAQTMPIETNASLTGFATSGIMAWGATTLGAWASGDLIIDTNGSIIQYATTYQNCTSGTATYALSVAVTRLE